MFAKRLFRKTFLSLAASLVLLPAVAWGQARSEGQLSGTVVDPSGATVPGVTLTLTQPATGFHMTVTSNSSGNYTFPDLLAGMYKLNVDAKGFAVFGGSCQGSARQEIVSQREEEKDGFEESVADRACCFGLIAAR
jgi:hypothetical protein